MAETIVSDNFGRGVMDDARVAEGIKVQAEHCRRNDAPVTARIVEAQLALMQGDTMCGRRIANWPGLPLEDALPLRFAGGRGWTIRSCRYPTGRAKAACGDRGRW